MKPKKRKKFNRKWYLPVAVVTVLLVVGAISIVASSGKTKEENSETNIEARSVKSLIDEVKAATLILAGKVMPNNSNKIKIDPERGTVKDILVNEGDVVEKGQPLFTYQTDQQRKVVEAEMDVEIKVRAVEQARVTANQKWTAHNQKVAELGKARQDYAKEKSEELQSTIKALEGEITGLHAEAIAGDNEVKNADFMLDVLMQNPQMLERIKAEMAKKAPAQKPAGATVVSSAGTGSVTTPAKGKENTPKSFDEIGLSFQNLFKGG